MDKLALMKAALVNRKSSKQPEAETPAEEKGETASVEVAETKKPKKKIAKKAGNYSFFQKAKTRGA